MKIKINNNYFYYIKNKDYINFLDYIFLLSIIEIQKPECIFIYHNQKFNNSKSSTNYYFNLIKNINLKIWTSNIIFKEINNDIYKEEIKKDMIKHGGIYIKKQCLILKNLENFLIYDYIKLNNICIGIKNDADEDLLINLNINQDKLNENTKNEISFLNINENVIYKGDICNMLNNIYDYNFEEYFNIIYNFYFIEFNNEEKYEKYEEITNNFNNNNINLLNLIIYYLLGYTYYFKNQEQNKYKNQNKNQLINEINKIFYINLKNHNLRNNNTINILNNFNIIYERVEGIDSNQIENIKSKFFNEKQTINNNTNAEYAVLLSHLNIIRNAENEEGKYFLILEDDICLDFMNYWKKSIKEIINEAPDDWEIIMLNYFTLNPKFETDYRLWNNEWSALSYIIKKSSIKKIETIINHENNKYNLYDDVNVADNYIFRLFKTYVYKYAYFTIPNNNKSTFHRDHDNYQKIYKNMNYLILNNVFQKYFY